MLDVRIMYNFCCLGFLCFIFAKYCLAFSRSCSSFMTWLCIGCLSPIIAFPSGSFWVMMVSIFVLIRKQCDCIIELVFLFEFVIKFPNHYLLGELLHSNGGLLL